MGDLRAWVERSLELENRGDIEGIAALYDPNAIFIDATGAEHRGRSAIADFYRRNRAAFPDFQAKLDRVIEEGEWVAFHGSWTGTHSRPQVLGETAVPPTGRRVEAAFVGIGQASTETGLMVNMRLIVVDQLGLMRQLGLLPISS